jgi:hypothetical protein
MALMGIDRVGLPYLVSVSRFGLFGAGIIMGLSKHQIVASGDQNGC